MANTSYNFQDFKYDPAGFNTNVFTAPEAANFSSNIFGGNIPSYDFDSYKFDRAFSPDITTRAFTPDSSSRSKGFDFIDTLGKGLEALSKARSYQQSATSGTSRRSGTYGSDAQVASQGRNWTLYSPRTTQKSTQSGGSSSPLGTIGSLVGTAGTALGVFGPLGPALGREVGSLFG